MLPNRAVQAIVFLLAAASLMTSARANGLMDVEFDSDLGNRSAFLQWMTSVEYPGRAAVIGIANRPCYVYEGSQLVVLPCPGSVVASTVDYAPPPVGYAVSPCRYRCRHGWVNSRY
jgi:hypothetical protein